MLSYVDNDQPAMYSECYLQDSLAAGDRGDCEERAVPGGGGRQGGVLCDGQWRSGDSHPGGHSTEVSSHTLTLTAS